MSHRGEKNRRRRRRRGVGDGSDESDDDFDDTDDDDDDDDGAGDEGCGDDDGNVVERAAVARKRRNKRRRTKRRAIEDAGWLAGDALPWRVRFVSPEGEHFHDGAQVLARLGVDALGAGPPRRTRTAAAGWATRRWTISTGLARRRVGRDRRQPGDEGRGTGQPARGVAPRPRTTGARPVVAPAPRRLGPGPRRGALDARRVRRPPRQARGGRLGPSHRLASGVAVARAGGRRGGNDAGPTPTRRGGGGRAQVAVQARARSVRGPRGWVGPKRNSRY